MKKSVSLPHKFRAVMDAEYSGDVDWEDAAMMFEEAVLVAQRELDQQVECIDNDCRRLDNIEDVQTVFAVDSVGLFDDIEDLEDEVA